MKRLTLLAFTFITILSVAIAGHLYWLSSLNGEDTFPQDSFLQTLSNKTALIIVAHDDDAIGCAGTISALTKSGWKVHFLTFYGNWRKHENPLRKKEVKKVAEIQKLSSTQLCDFQIQRSDTVEEPWMPIPYAEFSRYFDDDSLRTIIGEAVRKHKPSVLFTLDNVIGGYGHPEHVCVSQLALDVSLEDQTDSVQRIYQAVFTRTLNENVLRNNPAFIAAKKVYQAEGSPTPTIQFDIVDNSAEKKSVMLAYQSQARNLKKIWPFYNWYPHWLYFRIFDKEYFHVVTIR